MSDILSLHSPFNSMLNDVAEHFGHHITYVENCTEEWYFDLLGNLNEEGKSEFWHEVNHLMERFDSSKVKLQPRQNYAEQRKYLMKKQNKWLVMCIVRLLRLPWISSYSPFNVLLQWSNQMQLTSFQCIYPPPFSAM